MIKSPLRYPGGKNRAVKKIAALIPEFSEYREPFLGGGSVFVYLKQKYPNKIYWINDLFPNLFHFWKQSQFNLNELIDQIQEWKTNFQNGKELHQYLNNNIEQFDDLRKAAAFFVYNRITFSGTSESGGFSNAAYERRFTQSSIERVKLLSTLLDDVKITNYDYCEVVSVEGDNVFIFLDPPYFSAKKSALYGRNGHLHKTFDHERFASELKQTKHNWLITYDDSNYIRELFSFAEIIEWDLKYGMRNVNKNSDKTGKELFISNYSLDQVNMQQDLFKVESI